MKWLLICTLIAWGLTGWAYYAAEHAASDDFGAGALFWFAGAVAAILAVVYLAAAFWHHSFW